MEISEDNFFLWMLLCFLGSIMYLYRLMYWHGDMTEI
jgi:cbb3-type cytochrome oxidase subunit 3